MSPTSHPPGHLAVAPSDAMGAVLVLHPWWGLNDTMKQFCDRLAREGFIVFAPDLYRGEIATDIPNAERLSGALFKAQDRARADVDSAVAFLAERTGADSIAVVGFSMGAYYALDLSTRAPVDKVVLFYGTGPADFSKARAEYLVHLAGNDPYEPKEGTDQLAAALRAAGRKHTIHVYPGTGHWFFEPDRVDAYDEAAAQLAWDRTLEFLKR